MIAGPPNGATECARQPGRLAAAAACEQVIERAPQLD